MDRYEAELRKAVEVASPIPTKLYGMFVGFIFVGATRGVCGDTFYYRNPQTNEYHYETEFGRKMRLKIRENKFQRYAKK